MVRVAFIVLVCLLSVDALANDTPSVEDLLTVSQDDLLEMDTAITAQSASLREAPGVLTVISRDEIIDLGARSLEDVLLQVAGFSMAQDVEGVTDVGFRAIWAHEGKMLLLLDGQEMNEPLYASLQFGNHFLLSNVDRIEIIRGPGSVIYGGNAELGVINVISRTAKQVGKFNASATYGNYTSKHGRFVDNFARRNLELTFAAADDARGLEFTGALQIGQGNRSASFFTDFNGDTPYQGTRGNASLDPLLLNVGMVWKDLNVRLIFDRYHTTDRYPYDVLLPSPDPVDFITFLGDVQYTFHVTPTLTIVPRLFVKRQMPWHDPIQDDYNYSSDYYEKANLRSMARVLATWQATDEVSLMVGTQLTVDWATETLPPASYQVAQSTLFDNGKDYITYEDFAAYGQVVWLSEWANITAGGRFERHSHYGSAVVPRLAVTKAIGDFHVKALASQAFRAPAIENIHLDAAVKPEYLWAFELEAGYAINSALYVGVNVFDLTLSDPIIYEATGTQDGYANYHRTGSLGAEVELRYRGRYGFAGLSYAFASTGGKNDVSVYEVPQTANQVLGLPMHKGAANAGIRIGENWVLGPSLVVLGPRYGTLYNPGVIQPTPTTFLANLFVTYKDAWTRGLDVSLGVYNIFEQSFSYIQAYNTFIPGISNGRTPMPGLNREVLLRASWAVQ